MNEQGSQPPVMPAQIPVLQPHRKNFIGIIVLVIVVLLVAGGAAAYFFVPRFHNSVQDQVVSLRPSDEIQHLRFVTGSDANHLSLSGFGIGAAKTISYPDKTFVEVASVKGTLFALLKDNSGKTDVYRIPDAGNPVALTTDGRAKRSLVPSADGSLIAFSYVNNLPSDFQIPDGVDAASIFTYKRFEVAVLNVAAKTIQTYGDGLYAHFTDNHTLFYAVDTGFNSVDLDTQKIEFSKDSTPSRMFRDPVFLSPTEFLYYDPIAKRFSTMKIAHEGGQLVVNVEKMNTNLTPDMHAIASNGSGTLYGLYGNWKDGATLVRIEPSKITEMVHLPITFEPRDLVYVQ